MSSAEIGFETTVPVDSYLQETKRICDKIAEVKAENTQALFGDLHEMTTLYYKGALTQASRSFLAAQIFAGLVRYYRSSRRCVVDAEGKRSPSDWLILSGAVIQAISALNFYMYRKATKQFELFHVCLERMGRYLMANSVCANIESPERRDEARAELVVTMAHAPMLPIDGLHDARRNSKSQGRLRTAQDDQKR